MSSVEHPISRTKNLAERGMAMIQVMCAMAVAVILSLAILSSSVLQVQATANRVGGMQADALADSGLNLALYYMENPTSAPMTNAEGYWPGENNISLGSNVDGTVDVVVTRTSNTAAAATYSVTATGRAIGAVTHTARAVIQYNKGFTTTRAVSFSSSASLVFPLQIVGNVQARGTLTVPLLYPAVNLVGTGYAVNFNLLSIILNVRVPATTLNIPGRHTVNTYRTYTYAGQTYKAVEVTVDTLGGGGTVLGPTTDNPAGVYYYSRDNTSKSPTFTLNGNVTIDGTLVVDNAILQINGDNNVVNARNGFPALVASSDVVVLGGTPGILGIGATGSDVSLRGIAWVGGSMKTAAGAVNGEVYVNGSLMFGNGGAVDSTFNNKVSVVYDASRCVVPDLDLRNPSGPQIISWGR